MQIATAALIILVTHTAFAQSATEKPTFEVASIRPGSRTLTTLPNGMQVIGAMQGGPGTSDPETLTINSLPLKSIVLRAYGVQAYQLSGPEWIVTSRYDIKAKVPAGTTKEQLNLMLQSLLEERFSLKLHHETRELPAYNLVVGKNGLKLRNSVSLDGCSSGVVPVGAVPCAEESRAAAQNGITKSATTQGLIMTAPRGITTGRGVNIGSLAAMVQRQLAGPVVIDKTGLTDTYDFRMEFASVNVTTQDDSPLPSIFTALEKDLGLKLESTRTLVDTLIIDQISKPTDN
jgi:uncharacterized protein (TIGR03435 family)